MSSKNYYLSESVDLTVNWNTKFPSVQEVVDFFGLDVLEEKDVLQNLTLNFYQTAEGALKILDDLRGGAVEEGYAISMADTGMTICNEEYLRETFVEEKPKPKAKRKPRAKKKAEKKDAD